MVVSRVVHVAAMALAGVRRSRDALMARADGEGHSGAGGWPWGGRWERLCIKGIQDTTPKSRLGQRQRQFTDWKSPEFPQFRRGGSAPSSP